MQGKLDFIALKPHLKLSCSLTDEECQLLFKHEQNTPGSDSAHVLVELLRGKAPHCCARMLLNALNQSQKNSQNAFNDHTKVIELLHSKLQSMSRESSRIEMKLKGITIMGSYNVQLLIRGFQKSVEWLM